MLKYGFCSELPRLQEKQTINSIKASKSMPRLSCLMCHFGTNQLVWASMQFISNSKESSQTFSEKPKASAQKSCWGIKLPNCWLLQYNHSFVCKTICWEVANSNSITGALSKIQECKNVNFTIWTRTYECIFYQYLPKALIHEHVDRAELVWGLWTAFTCKGQQNRLAASSSSSTSTSKTTTVYFQ